MKTRPVAILSLILLGLACLALPAPAQKSASPREITVIVVKALPAPPQPVNAVRVSLSYLDSGVTVSEAQNVTNSQGQALLEVSLDATQRGDLRIAITGASGLAIYDPADGQLASGLGPSVKSITVNLLPRGSFALLGPVQIQAYLHRLLLQVNSLQKQVAALKAQGALGQGQQQVDAQAQGQQQAAAQAQGQQQYLATALSEFAQAMGFTPDQVNQQVQIWAQNVQLQSAQATKEQQEQKALAAFALKDYAAAALDFNQAADATEKQIDADETAAGSLEKARQSVVDKARDELRQLVNQRQQAAGADQLNLKYHEATETLESAEATAEAEYKKHPDDKGFHGVWLQAASSAANARRREGEVGPAGQSLPLLAQCAQDFQLLAREYLAFGDRQGAASAQDGLGDTLEDEGQRATDDSAMLLLKQAVQAYQDALEVYTQADLPQDWAATQADLGNALVEEANNTDPFTASMPVIQEAVKAYRNALEVRTRAALPLDWARTQMGLGNALTLESLAAAFVSLSLSTSLHDQAVEAYRNALQVLTKADQPQDWAATQMNLGGILLDEGMRAHTDDKALAWYDQAVEAYRAALQVYTEADLPQDWAKTQGKLGIALTSEGVHAGDDKAIALFDEAAAVYRNMLQVYTEADLPVNWAETQNHLGYALELEGDRANGEKAIALLNQAAEANRTALQVFTKAARPQDWALTQMDLGDVLVDEGLHAATGDKAMAWYDQAVEAYHAALQVYTQADNPFEWPMTQVRLGIALVDEGERASGEKAIALLNQAVEAYRNALLVDTEANASFEWAETQNYLGVALEEEGQRASREKAAALFGQAVEAYRRTLEVYTKAGQPNAWANTQGNLGLALKDEGEHTSEDNAVALFAQAADAYKLALEALTKADQPQDWAYSQNSLGEVLMGEGERTGGDQAGVLLDEAVQDFQNALEVFTKANDPNDWSNLQWNLLEADLGAAHFDACIGQTGILATDAVSPSTGVLLGTMKLACEWGSGDKSTALETEKALLSTATARKKGNWDFAGFLHLLSVSPIFEKGRASWIALFTAVQNGDGAGMTAALHKLKPILQQ